MHQRWSRARAHRYAIRFTLLVVGTMVVSACGAQQAQPSGVSKGQSAPGFTLPAVGDKRVALGDYAGQEPVLLYFHMAAG